MLNAEKYKDEILKICNLDGRIALTDNGVHMCGSVRCKNCKFHGERNCIAVTLEWLIAEYKEPVKLTRFEYEILKNLKSDYAYISRDVDGDICFLDQPDEDIVKNYLLFDETLKKPLFTFITQKGGIYGIEEILENCEVIDDD